MTHLRGILQFAMLLTAATSSLANEHAADNWHQWRGPEANGVSRTSNPPLNWSEEQNVQWKAKIEGQGSATPIVWGERIFLLTAVDTGKVDPSLPKPEDQPKRVFGITHPNTTYEFVVLCLDRETGAQRWRRIATQRIPHEGTHGDNDFASASPTTDGKRLYCWFGSQGLFCYDLDGKLLWQRDLGKAYIGASLGEGCSPVVHNGRLVILRDHAQQSTIEVLDAQTGLTVWKQDRDEPNAWATPRVIEHSGKTQVITAASNMVRSYDLENGDILWQCGGLTGNVIPCPVVEGDVVYCMSGYKGHSLLALPLSERGDLSGSDKIVWSRNRGTPYTPSPLLYDGMLYFNQSNSAILSCVAARTGETILSRTRLPALANIYASPVGAAQRIYIAGRNGTTLVLKRSAELDVLATNELDDSFHASPALAGNQLLLRGRESLYCLADEDRDTTRETSTLPHREQTIEEKTRVHRLSTKRRAAYDAFVYVNRIPEKPEQGETAEDLAGRIFGRLANQEGRVLLKLPTGMDRDAYLGFKTFLRYQGETGVGNCAACHTPADFTDLKTHVVARGEVAEPTPSLRNLNIRRTDLKKILTEKIQASEQKRSGEADDIDEAYAIMNISEDHIPELVAFLALLRDVPDTQFRKLILDAKVLDTSDALGQ